jgi:hypothetical protein
MGETIFGVCRHCDEPIIKFHFKDEGDQWWHANTSAAISIVTPQQYIAATPGRRAPPAPTYRRCHADPGAPFAEPR